MPEETRVDRLITRLKNHRIVAPLIIIAIILIAIASFTSTGLKLFDQMQRFLPITVFTMTLRHEPTVLSSENVKVMLRKHGFYDKNWNPGGGKLIHHYETQIKNGSIVLFDDETKLMWQKGGSRRPMEFAKTEEYINRLNSEKYAGYTDWRLPTLEEAMSLMEANAVDRVHIDKAFEHGINFIWTSDKTSDGRIWMLYFYDGMVGLERADFNLWVRVVRYQ